MFGTLPSWMYQYDALTRTCSLILDLVQTWTDGSNCRDYLVHPTNTHPKRNNLHMASPGHYMLSRQKEDTVVQGGVNLSLVSGLFLSSGNRLNMISSSVAAEIVYPTWLLSTLDLCIWRANQHLIIYCVHTIGCDAFLSSWMWVFI
jgi:hypothetical protein